MYSQFLDYIYLDMASFTQMSTFRVGTFNKPSRSDQDRFFVFRSESDRFVALCVIDGHGRLGTHCAERIKKTLEDCCIASYESFFDSPYVWLNNVFDTANSKITQFDGGATCTLCVIANNIMYVAYVGDSSALLMTREPLLDPSLITDLTELVATDQSSELVATDQSSELVATDQSSELVATDQSTEIVKTNHLLFCDDHSPENPEEYQRMIAINPSIRCVYDRSDATYHNVSKYLLPKINDEKRGLGYHKNVRKEPATLVTKNNGRALAMTRSLGDLWMKPEVTHVPTIKRFDLSSTLESPCLIIASDGVWDNWQYQEVHDFFMNESNKSLSVDEQALAFCNQNDLKGTENFGSHKDDVSGIIFLF